MVFHILVINLIILFIFVLTTPTQNFPIAKVECVDRCGKIKIPFPFGTTPDCYHDPTFLVNCSHTLKSSPKLFWENSTIEITDISLDGQIKVKQFIASECYARNGTRIFRKSPSIRLPIHFTANNTANKFTIVGCDAYGFVYGRRLNKNYETGCTAECYAKDDLMEDVNECQDPSLNKCKHECVNTEGGYYCRCRKGYHGDGIIGREGCIHEQSSLLLGLVAAIAGGIIVLLLLAILLYVELKRRSLRKTKQKFFLQNGGTLLQEKLTRREASPDMVKIFTSSELEKATNTFHNSMIIGQGGFGIVYKGLLPDKRVVAIKKSKGVDSNQIEQFINEVFVLSQINHRNVVRLLGCCLETEVPLLVYEFISNGTLSAHIHKHMKARFLKWETRLRIAAETAGVLSYLHSAASTPIIHRDVKSDNILLDDNFTAKVSDFGASKLVPMDLKQLSTVVLGTLGYLDPEYMQTHQLTEKSDVYSFGVVLLELLPGRKAISFNKPEEEKTLTNFFFYMLKQERFFEILDDNVVGDANMEQVSEVARLAKECLNVRGEDRPSMKEVAMELEGLIVGGTHSWSRNAGRAEEMEYLVGKGIELISFGNVNDGSSSIATYDKHGYDSLELSGGR